MLPLMMHQKFLIRRRDRVDEMVVDQLSRVDGGRPDQSGRWPSVLVGGLVESVAEEYEPMLYFSKHINNPLRGASNHEEIPLAAINDVISTSEFDSQFPDDNKPFMQHQWLQKSFCNLQSADPASSTPLQTLNGEKKKCTQSKLVAVVFRIPQPPWPT